MNSYNFVLWAQIIKTSLLLLLFVIILVHVYKKLVRVLRKGTNEPIDFTAVSKLLSLGLTVLLLSGKFNNLFQSLFRIFVSSFDYLSYLLSVNTVLNNNASNGGVSTDFIRFPFADLILVFASWLFLNTLLTIFFQRASTTNSPQIFSDKLFAKNTFVVILLIFSVYLCVASIVAIPEFQLLENSEVNNEELVDFSKELDLQATSSKDDLLLKELSATDLKSNRSVEFYSLFNDRISNYNRIINAFLKDQELQRNQAVDAYKSAILEKTAPRERIKYRTQLKNWVQDRAGVFTFFTYYKPRFETIVRGVMIALARVEKDSLLRVNDAKVDSVYNTLGNYTDEWERNQRTLEENALNLKNIRYGVPEKPKIGEKYGVFESMSGWLLSTESMSLALIVGLFAFGLLGSIGSTFIRQRIKTGADADTKDFIPNLPAVLINGISSAIVVFLAVKGTLVIFSGKDTSLNPYVLFFTCLVAAVFSEDVWKWAQNKLDDQFNSKDGSQTNKSKQTGGGNGNA